MSSRRMFGRYFHALTTYSPLLNRIIAPRLLNTEMEERMFGQCKAITRNTSNQHANDIITNILVYIQYEHKRVAAETNTVKNQESEVLKLAQALRGKENTVIPMEWLQHMSVHYQAHLEMISDYLLQGPGIWWQYVEDGVEFFDVHIPHPQLQTQTPSAHHFRSLTLGDVDTYLLSKWEQCQEEKIELPAQYIRTYQTNGDSNSIISNPVSLIPCSSREPSQSAQVRPPLSLTPCSSREPGQPAQVRPLLSLTPCSSREPGQPTQVRPPLSLTPCSSREPGQPAQVRPPLSLTPCSSREPGQPAQVRPPCSSREPGQPAQVRPPLSLTP